MTKNLKKINYIKWSVIVTALIGIPGAVAALLTIPDLGCKVGLNIGACVIIPKEVEFVIQSETGESLSGVTLSAIAAKGAPEVQYTDDRGYVKVNIPSKGNVRITLTKKGYTPQDFNLNLENSEDTIRVIRFSPTGQPNVQITASLPPSTSPTPSSSPSPSTPSPNPTSVASSENQVKTDSDVTWELKQCVRKRPDVSCSFVLTTTNPRRNYELDLDKRTKMTDHQGYEYFASKGTFLDNKAGFGSALGHEMQNGATYTVTIDFTKIPTSVSNANSMIVSTYGGNSLKFDDIAIK